MCTRATEALAGHTTRGVDGELGVRVSRVRRNGWQTAGFVEHNKPCTAAVTIFAHIPEQHSHTSEYRRSSDYVYHGPFIGRLGRDFAARIYVGPLNRGNYSTRSLRELCHCAQNVDSSHSRLYGPSFADVQLQIAFVLLLESPPRALLLARIGMHGMTARNAMSPC